MASKHALVPGMLDAADSRASGRKGWLFFADGRHIVRSLNGQIRPIATGHMMLGRIISTLGLCAVLASAAWSQEVKRRVISRADLTGTNMEVVLVETEIPPGATSPRHTHPGEEAFYVVQGTTVETPGQQPVARETGSGGINAREVPHAGYKVVGDKPLKMVNVYIVDKGKPLSTPAK